MPCRHNSRNKLKGMIVRMLTAGIDAGAEYTKAVILENGELLGRGCAASGGAGRDAAARDAYRAALAAAGRDESKVEKIVSTGIGKYDVSFATDRYTDGVALAKGVRQLCPAATMVIQCGADETLAVTVTPEGGVGELVLNQKCSAGLGTFLRTMGRRLGMTAEEMGAVPVQGLDVPVSDGCTAFAELDALDMLNDGASPAEVAAAVTKAVAVRAATVVNDVILADTGHVALTGGMAKNPAFVKALAERTGLALDVCENGEYTGAIGAGLLAAQ